MDPNQSRLFITFAAGMSPAAIPVPVPDAVAMPALFARTPSRIF